MDTILLSTAYHPPILYFAAILSGNKTQIEIHETFPKQTWRNRCTILSSQGSMNLSIPVKRHNNSETIEVDIEQNQHWKNNHWRAIEAAYNKSPYFMYYRDQFHQLTYQSETNLVKFNQNIIDFYLHIFKIDKEISFTNEYKKNIDDATDLRETLHPKKQPLIPYDSFPSYYQVFSNSFHPNLSILDLLNNEGPNGIEYLNEIAQILTQERSENN